MKSKNPLWNKKVHNHKGRPKWVIMWANQYERKYVCCTKWTCSMYKSKLIPGLAAKRKVKIMTKVYNKCNKNLSDFIFTCLPALKIMKGEVK